MKYDLFDINYGIDLLIKHFNDINSRGWYERRTNDEGEMGKNFESLLGIEQNNFQVPDFEGIEIKTKKIKCYDNFITLFNSVPYGNDFFEIQRLQNAYGYPSTDLKSYKVLNGDVFCKKMNKIGMNYFFQTKIDYNESKIKLLVFDKYRNLIDNSTFWQFNIIREKLYCKLKYLAIIKVNTKRINGKQFYKYESIEIYKLKNFQTFLKAIEYDYIKIQFKISVYKSGKRIGQTHDRGTGFQVDERHINYLYTKIYSNK